MNVAGVVTSESELMQLGLNLGVHENDIKRIIARKYTEFCCIIFLFFLIALLIDSITSLNTGMHSSRMRTVHCSSRLPAMHAPWPCSPLPHMPPTMHAPAIHAPPSANHAPSAMHAPICHACPTTHAPPLHHTCTHLFAMHTSLCHACAHLPHMPPLPITHIPSCTEFLTHACENITFP